MTVASAAIVLACFPSSFTHLNAAPAAADAPAVQDTTRVRRGREEPEARAAEPGERAPSDSAAADSAAGGLGPFPGPDSVMQALLERAGYRPVIYRGDTLQFSTRDRTIHIRERAHIQREGDELFADSVVYEGETRWVTAYGTTRMINMKGEEVDSEEGPFFYNVDRRIGTVMNGRTQWEAWNVEGNFTLEGTDTLWVKEGYFSSCDLPEAHYRFEADKIKLVLNNIVVAWPVRVYFGDVPVFWFPFMAQDIRRGRHSGLLSLAFGVNDIVRNSSGHNRHISNVGYYWAISDYMDAQLSMDWWSDTWTRFDGFYRYRWLRQFMNGALGYSHFLLPNGSKEIALSWNHTQKIGERSDLRASVQYVSSSQFEREAEYNPERLTQKIRSDIGFTRRFDWGTMSLSGQRIQPLTPGEVTTTTLPQMSITLTPIVLTPAASPLESSWYNGLTWNGSTRLGYTTSTSELTPKITVTTAGLNSGLTLGKLRWSSSGNYREQQTFKPDTLIADPDTAIVGPDTTITQDTLVIGPRIKTGDLTWQTSMGYQQRLIGTTTLTPSLDLSGSFFRSNETGLALVSAPTRIAVRATLNSDVYGFFPGFGPVERIRHKFAPGISWAYSPEAKASPELEGLQGFNPADIKARNVITIGLNQTFEAKLKPREQPTEEPAEGDSALAQERGPGQGQQGQQEEQARKIMLLGLRTSAVTYDFVAGELTTSQLSNTFTSDLLRGLSLRTVHSLFDQQPDGSRKFDLFLTQVNLGFSLGSRQLAGLLGQGIARGAGIVPVARDFEDSYEDEVPPEEDEPDRGGGGRGRPWSVNVNYSLVRQRPPLEGVSATPTRQTVNWNLGFSPTDNWTMNWRTTYDMEESEFVDQALSLRRDLHRWSATFEFLKASNGNFVFSFRVNLNDLQDIKFDYRQESRGSGIN